MGDVVAMVARGRSLPERPRTRPAPRGPRGHRWHGRAPGTPRRRARSQRSVSTSGSTIEGPRSVRRTTRAVQVRREHPGGEVLDDAVLHDLDGRRAEPLARPERGALDELRDLLERLATGPTTARRPRERSDVPSSAQAAYAAEASVMLAYDPEDGVLPRGDSDRVQVRLRLEQRLDLLAASRVGDERPTRSIAPSCSMPVG